MHLVGSKVALLFQSYIEQPILLPDHSKIDLSGERQLIYFFEIDPDFLLVLLLGFAWNYIQVLVTGWKPFAIHEWIQSKNDTHVALQYLCRRLLEEFFLRKQLQTVGRIWIFVHLNIANVFITITDQWLCCNFFSCKLLEFLFQLLYFIVVRLFIEQSVAAGVLIWDNLWITVHH